MPTTRPVQSTTVTNPPSDFRMMIITVRGNGAPPAKENLAAMLSKLMPHTDDTVTFTVTRTESGMGAFPAPSGRAVASMTGLREIPRFTITARVGEAEDYEIGRIIQTDKRTFEWASGVTEDEGGEATFALAFHKLVTIWLQHKQDQQG